MNMTIAYVLLALALAGILIVTATWLWSIWWVKQPTKSLNDTIEWSNDHNFRPHRNTPEETEKTP